MGGWEVRLSKGAVVSVRLTDTDRARLQQTADRYGMSLSEFIRLRVLRSLLTEEHTVNIPPYVSTTVASPVTVIWNYDWPKTA